MYALSNDDNLFILDYNPFKKISTIDTFNTKK